jgi:phospholipase/carboxylesterase
MEQQNLEGPRVSSITGKAGKLVIFLHGYGADGADLIALGEQWQGQLLDADFVSPNAPQICDNQPMGYQWFPLNFTAQGVVSTPQERRQGAQQAAPAINAFIDAELARTGLKPSKLALVGFSQGAMMALYVGLRRADPLAAIVSFSGMLLEDDKAISQASKQSVFLAHGTMDDVVPFEALGLGEQALKKAGVDVTSHVEHGIGHGIDARAMMLAGEFLAAKLT